MSINDPSLASSSGFRNAEYVDSNLDEDLEEQNVPRIWQKKNVLQWLFQFFSENSGFIEKFDRLSTPTRWCNWSTFVKNQECCEL
ncbi:hypothetical protein NPIL_463141 [Nephila pilipes]|uniref:Uncharacterized protein n=1 Tax=Nephila pilipes TaxID=299642 RepID=A0A8X6TMI7_NEPPI|nr:hypothetical protein NPIL_463141 [Nephila pilipes]